MRRLSTLVPLALALSLAGCGEGSSGPPPAPASVVAVSANPLPAQAVASVVSAQPTFEVRAADGRVLRDVPVSVAVTFGGGSLSGAPTVSSSGPTAIGAWTLGTTAGPQAVTVSVSGIAPLVFTAPSTPGAPAQLQMIEGNNQFGVTGAVVGTPLRVRVRDSYDNPVPGAVVTWSVDVGGGTLAAPSSTTDAQGIATAPAWTLGPVEGEQAVVASLSSLNARFVAVTGVEPASLAIEIAPPATSTVGAALTTAPAFTVRDDEGTAIIGFPVSVAVTGGGGSLTGAPTMTTSGATAIGTWTLGTMVGEQEVTVTVAGLAPTVFTLDATAGPTTAINVIAGNGQSAFAGDFVGVNPRLRLLDQYGNRVPGATVLWQVSAGEGTLSGSQTITDAQGETNGPTWRLGRFGGPQELTAVANGRVATVAATIQTNFTVDLRYVGTPPEPAVQQAFSNAKRRIEAIIVGDVPDVTLTNFVPSTGCVASGVDPINGILDDIMIFAIIDSIDGPGGVLGSAGPCATRNADGLTAYGRMRFDRLDMPNLIAQGRLEAVILHEMLHVIGIGTLWTSRGLLLEPGTANVRFIGGQAVDACVNQANGAAVCPGYVPAENCLDLPPTQNCGAGTINSHWKESTFQSELMTGYLGSGLNPFSAMTIRSLADMGYQVNVLAADTYLVPSNLMALMDDFGVSAIRMPTPRMPTHRIDASGRETPLPKQ